MMVLKELREHNKWERWGCFKHTEERRRKHGVFNDTVCAGKLCRFVSSRTKKKRWMSKGGTGSPKISNPMVN